MLAMKRLVHASEFSMTLPVNAQTIEASLLSQTLLLFFSRRNVFCLNSPLRQELCAFDAGIVQDSGLLPESGAVTCHINRTGAAEVITDALPAGITA